MWWGEGVTFINGAVDQRKKNLMKKKIGIDQGAGSLETDRRTEKEKREKDHKDPPPARQREKKRKRKRQRKKVEKKEIYKGRNTHSPLPHCTRI